MKNIDDLKKFRVNSVTDNNNYDNIFYKVDTAEIIDSESKLGFKLPSQLREFYIKIGYGFFHKSQDSINRLLSPLQIAQINLREDFYEFDPDLEIYDEIYSDGKILFFDVNEGLYLAIDKNNSNKFIYLIERYLILSIILS